LSELHYIGKIQGFGEETLCIQRPLA